MKPCSPVVDTVDRGTDLVHQPAGTGSGSCWRRSSVSTALVHPCLNIPGALGNARVQPRRACWMIVMGPRW